MDDRELKEYLDHKFSEMETNIIQKLNPKKLFYSSTEFCEEIGISRQTFAKWILSGKLVAIKPEGKRDWKIPLDVVQEFKNSRTKNHS